MSYVNMDHAGWVEQSIAAHKRQASKADQRRAIDEQRGWCAAPDVLNDFQRRAFGILGIVGNGIYNAPIAWTKVWWHPTMLQLPWYNEVASFDFTGLTRLVFLCHEARIRCGISAHARDHLGIHLGERSHEGGMSRRHPNLDEAIADFRAWFPADHSINYQPKDLAK